MPRLADKRPYTGLRSSDERARVEAVEPVAVGRLAGRAKEGVRAKAAEWGIDPHRVGFLGFSAGGHLTAVAETNFDKRAYDAIDDADRTSCRPDFAVVVYPGGVWRKISFPMHGALDVVQAAVAGIGPVVMGFANVFYLLGPAIEGWARPADVAGYRRTAYGMGLWGSLIVPGDPSSSQLVAKTQATGSMYVNLGLDAATRDANAKLISDWVAQL